MPTVMLRVPLALLQQTPAKPKRKKRRADYVPSSASRRDFLYNSTAWKALPSASQAAFNALCPKMQQAGLLPPGTKQSGYTLFQQMNRAVGSLYLYPDWSSVPDVPAPPPAPPKFTVTAMDNGTRTVVHLHAPAFPVGCQVWVSKIYVPGCRDPYKQRTTLRGGLPGGWPDGGVDLNAVLDGALPGQEFHPRTGMAFVVKIVPVSAAGFVGPPLSEVCVVE